MSKKVKIYTEEFLYEDDIQNLLKYTGLYRLPYEIINVASSNNSSFLDCVIELVENDKVLYGCGVEITQTTDRESRNSSVYQRPQKFIQFEHYYPNYNKLMYYTNPFELKTDTSRVGMGILHLMGIDLYNVIGDYPKTIEELIELKNSMKAKGNNIPVSINLNKKYIEISAKLEKSNSFSHDPNIGFISSICYLFKNDKRPVRLINHCLTEDMINSKNKLYQNMNIIEKNLHFVFKNKIIEWKCSKEKYTNKDTYLRVKEDGEKVSLIKFIKHLEKKRYEIIFKNIAGCKREKLKYRENKITVPKKIQIPDLVYLNKNNIPVIIEAECDYNLKKGIKQLKTFEDFKKFLKLNVTNKKPIMGVITDKYVDYHHSDYFGYFLCSTKNLLNEIVY